jgi:formate-dependent nitrite reductase cytochrome c552 subunit
MWIAAVFSTVAACNRSEHPRALERSSMSDLSRPAQPAVQQPSRQLTSIESSKRDPLGRPIRVACVTCHSQRKVDRLPESTAELDEFHGGLTFRHGELACGSCHVAAEEPRLRLADGRTLPMTDAMKLCSQCHGPQRRDYDHGAHGGMQGSWSHALGERERNECVDCHDPHAPAYVGGKPVLPPRDRGLTQSQENTHD